MVEFEVLGQVRLHSAAGEVALTSMMRRLLGLLVAHAGRPVKVDTIVEALWETNPPRTARKTLQIYVHRLRRMLDGDHRVLRSEAGYTLTAEPAQIDAAVFEGLVHKALAAKSHGDLATAERLLAQGLALWTGAAYTGLRHISEISAEAARLDEMRLVAFEEHVDIELELGRHGELVSKLSVAIAKNPYRERLRGQVMLALFRDGRQAEALRAYRQTRELLVAEVGVEPNAALQHLHQAILRHDPTFAGKPAPANRGFRFLPHGVPDFVGRVQDLAWLDSQPSPDSPAMAISVITGPAGIGKTALVVHWAHRAANRFPHGQLYISLRGFGADRPLRPLDALLHLLRCLGVPHDRLPSEVDDAAALYRSMLADRRILVVLDDAGSAEQVRPLLPGTSSCRVLITSRDPLGCLVSHDGARRRELGPLGEDHAAQLLRRLIRREEPEAVARLLTTCGGLPLALRVAAAGFDDEPSLAMS